MEVLRDILSIPKTIYKEVRSGHTQRSYSHSRRQPEGRSYRDDGYGYVEPESRSRSRTSRVDSGYGSGSRGRRRQVSDPDLSTKRTKDYRNGYGSIEREREERAAAGELDEEEVIRVKRRDREDRKRYRESVEGRAEYELRRAREDAAGSRRDNERHSIPNAEAIHLAEWVRNIGQPPKVYVTEQTTSSNHPTTRDHSIRRDSRPTDRPRTKMLDHQFWSDLGPRGRERAANRCRDDLNEAYPEFTDIFDGMEPMAIDSALRIKLGSEEGYHSRMRLHRGDFPYGGREWEQASRQSQDGTRRMGKWLSDEGLLSTNNRTIAESIQSRHRGRMFYNSAWDRQMRIIDQEVELSNRSTRPRQSKSTGRRHSRSGRR